MQKYLVANTSDFHTEKSAEVAIDYISSNFPKLNQFALLGDRSIDPDFSKTKGVNLLREVKLRAKEQGEDYIEAENKFWENGYRDVLVEQWLGILKPTQRMHEYIEQKVRINAIPQVYDLGGNDFDKEERVKKAYAVSDRKGKTLLDILNNSPAFENHTGVRLNCIGSTLEVNIPYIESQTETMLATHCTAIKCAIEKYPTGLKQIVFRSHSNSDPKLRKEKNNEWYLPVFESALGTDAKVFHIFGHCHKLPEPYEYKGVTLVPVGYGEKEQKQRVFVMDYYDPGKNIIKDLDL